MITGEKIKKLADGKEPNQLVTFIVQAPGSIIPAVILNVYLNLDMEFVMFQSSMSVSKSSIISKSAKNPVITSNFIFSTDVDNFEKYFGPYHPAKILEFQIPEK